MNVLERIKLKYPSIYHVIPHFKKNRKELTFLKNTFQQLSNFRGYFSKSVKFQ